MTILVAFTTLIFSAPVMFLSSEVYRVYSTAQKHLKLPSIRLLLTGILGTCIATCFSRAVLVGFPDPERIRQVQTMALATSQLQDWCLRASGFVRCDVAVTLPASMEKPIKAVVTMFTRSMKGRRSINQNASLWGPGVCSRRAQTRWTRAERKSQSGRSAC